MTTSEHIFETDLGANGGQLKFKSHEEITAFINQEYQYWTWLNQLPANGHNPSSQAWNLIHNKYNEMNSHHQQWKSNPSYEAHFRNSFEAYFITYRIPISNGKYAKFISDLRKRHGDIVAASALSALVSAHQQLGSFPYILGAVEMATFDMGINAKTPEAVNKALEGLLQKFTDDNNQVILSGREQFNRLDSITTNQIKQFDKSDAYTKRLSKTMQRWTAHRIKMHKRRKDAEIAKSIEEFKAVENTYKEAMKLKAPATYWIDKSKEHKTNADNIFHYLMWIAGVGVPAIILMLSFAIWFGQEKIKIDTPFAILGLFGSIGIFITTVIFWMARLTLKMYLSERHLATDAKERETMAMTYLALTNDGKVEKEDRGLVLTGLFRSSSDGIVKDDAAPDFGLTTILSKAMSK